MDVKIIEKIVKFNDKEWLIKIKKNAYNINEIEVLKQDDINIHKWLPFDNNKFVLSNMTLMEMCKQVILESNSILYPVNEYEELMKWDGDMDKELNIR